MKANIKSAKTTKSARRRGRSEKKWAIQSQGATVPTPLGPVTINPIAFTDGQFPAPKTKGRARGLRSYDNSDAMVMGVAYKSKPIQVIEPEIYKMDKRGACIRGTDELLSCTLADPAAAGDLLCSFAANPSNLPSISRGNILSSMFTRYRFKRLQFHFEPALGTQNDGQLIGAVGYDINEVPLESDPTNVPYLAAQMGQARCNVWRATTWEMNIPDSLQSLFISNDEADLRLSTQGWWALCAATAINYTKPLGVIYVSYDIEFTVPEIRISAALTPTKALALLAEPCDLGFSGEHKSGIWLYPPGLVTGEGWPNNITYEIALADFFTTIKLIGIKAGAYLINIFGVDRFDTRAIREDSAADAYATLSCTLEAAELSLTHTETVNYGILGVYGEPAITLRNQSCPAISVVWDLPAGDVLLRAWFRNELLTACVAKPTNIIFSIVELTDTTMMKKKVGLMGGKLYNKLAPPKNKVKHVVENVGERPKTTLSVLPSATLPLQKPSSCSGSCKCGAKE